MNWNLFLILIGISIPGIIITIPGTLKTINTMIEKNQERIKFSKPKLYFISFFQIFLLVTISSALGTILTPKIDFDTPFFEALIEGRGVWNQFNAQLLPALFYSIIGAVIFISAYYLFFRPRLDPDNVDNMEQLRNNIGILGRVFYGGVVEEILIRWGLLPLFIWILSLIFNVITPLTIWISIILSGIIFAIGHLPSYLGAGCKPTPMFISLMISLNLIASLLFGWLFWQYGLISAIMGHSIFHIVWYPFDIHYQQIREKEKTRKEDILYK